ncbi:hypothetical protein ACFOHS_16150 [Jhaorihella thermophila]
MEKPIWHGPDCRHAVPSPDRPFFAVTALISACQEEETSVPPPSQDCICARACGIPVVSNSHWVNAQGQAVALGYCPPLHDEILYEKPRPVPMRAAGAGIGNAAAIGAELLTVRPCG